MNNHFQRLQNLDGLQDLLAQSEAKPVVIFKHSTTCPISASAYREMVQLQAEVGLVEVQSARDVSQAVAANSGIEHQSPQVIIFRRGKPVWHTSHWEITKETVAEALLANA